MNHHELFFSISIGANILFGLALFNFWKWNRMIVAENKHMSDVLGRIYVEECQRDEAWQARQEEYAEQRKSAMTEAARPVDHDVTVDHQTYLLIYLAANNTNENEARAAAMQACLRISQQSRQTKFLLKAAP